MTYMTLIGLLAAACTTFAFVPQVLQTMRTRHTKDISLVMYLIFTMGVFLWLIYGLLLWSLPLILANILTLILAVWILVLKLKHG